MELVKTKLSFFINIPIRDFHSALFDADALVYDSSGSQQMSRDYNNRSTVKDNKGWLNYMAKATKHHGFGMILIWKAHI